jgi:5-methylcytosine-specific restriction endonuclease McrA
MPTRSTKKEKVCRVCGKITLTKPSQDRKYCSYECLGKSKRKNFCFDCGGKTSRKGVVRCSLCNAKWCVGERRGKVWKNGISKENEKIRQSKQIKDWRTAVFERDNFTCVICNQRGGRLNADHIKRFSHYPELRFDINNGRTLCEACHKKTDNYGNKDIVSNFPRDLEGKFIKQ